MIQPSSNNNAPTDDDKLREVRYEYSNNLAGILDRLKISLFFSTYQAGKLGVVTAKNNSLDISFHNFDRAMGMAISPTQMAVGGRDWVYFLRNDASLASQIEPAGSYDACYLTRGAQYTGDISIHDLAWGSQELWMVNTRFSCLCTLTNSYNFLPQWRPPFVSALAPEDRCHLNGVAMVEGMPKYVSVLGQTDTPGGWRDNKATHGCILEVPSGKVITEGLSMPHSPRVYQNVLWVLNSGHGGMVAIDLASNQKANIVSLPGYTRGLAFAGRFAFVGLSKIRETAIFGNLPIGDRFDELKCGIAVVDLPEKKAVGYLEFQAGIDEIFDVQVLGEFSQTKIAGPHATTDGEDQIWSLPAP
jgi:uncharacterized protein (TIGR03032 family)